MIISKPNKSAIFSLSIFLIIAYVGGIWSALVVPSSPAFWYLIPILCLSTAVVVTIKVVYSYRTLIINGEHWKVRRLFRKEFGFHTKDISWWKVTEIKTGGGNYRELHIQTAQGKSVKVSLQEHTEYQKIYKKVRTKCPKKQVQSPN